MGDARSRDGLPPRSWEQPWRPVLAREFAFRWAFASALPRVYRRGQWVSRLGRRGLALYVVARTAERYATLTWLLPPLRGVLADKQRWRRELADQLGREPTDEEAHAYQQQRWREEHPDLVAQHEGGKADRVSADG